MTELESLESRHAALCEEINEGSDEPTFNRRIAIEERDRVWSRIVELSGEVDDD